MQKLESLAPELPYWEFLSDPVPHVVLTDGSLVMGFRSSLTDIECFDESEVNGLTQALRSALNSLPETVTCQFHLTVRSGFSEMIEAHAEGLSVLSHPVVRRLAEERIQGLRRAQEEGRFYRPQLSIYLRMPLKKAKQGGFFSKKEEFQAAAEAGYSETLGLLKGAAEGLVSSFAAVGASCETLSREEMIKAVYSFLNPKRSTSEPAPRLVPVVGERLPAEVLAEAEWLSDSSPREQLVFGDLVLQAQQFVLDSYAHRVVTLKTLPEVTIAGQLASFLRMPFHYDLLLSVQVPPQASEMARLQRARKMAHSMAVTHGGRASDLESESKLSSTEELIRELLNTGQRIYTAQVAVVLRAPNTEKGEKELNGMVREVLSRFRALQGAEGMEESVGAWKVAKGTFLAAPCALERPRKMKTDNLADFLPVYGPHEGDAVPVAIFRNRLGGLLGYDAFDPGLPNYNTLVTGSSGAGKSFLNNCILLQELATGQEVFVIDIGGSYRKLTQALSGQYVQVSLEMEKINPFHIDDAGSQPSSQKVKSLLACIECMVAEDGKSRLPKLERTLLEKEILELYEEMRGRVPTLSDLKARLERSPEPSLQAVAKLLFMWTGYRPYGRLLDGQGRLSASNGVCTFDLKGLNSYPDLQAVMILILTDFIMSEIEKRGGRKRIVMDEAWSHLQSPGAAAFMEHSARAIRKTGSGITFITQGVEEVESSPVGPAILNNTATKFVMLQRGDTEILSQTLKLNTKELDLIHSLEQRKGVFSEGFMVKGDRRQVVRIYPTPLEYWLATSDAEDNRYLDQLEATGLSLLDALETAAGMYPNGRRQGVKE